MTKEQSKQFERVRRHLINGLKKCDELPSTMALAALIELTVDTAITLMGRESAVDCISKTVNSLMMTKYRRMK